MRWCAAMMLCALVVACGNDPVDPANADLTPAVPSLSVVGADQLEGAIVLNEGQASEPYVGTCTVRQQTTTDVTMVRTPDGGGLLRCQWPDWQPSADFDRAVVVSGFGCYLTFFGVSVTDHSQFVLAANEAATMTCTFPSVPTPPTGACYGQITSGIASTWPWAHEEGQAFPPPPGSLAQWIATFGPLFGIDDVHDLQILFCGG